MTTEAAAIAAHLTGKMADAAERHGLSREELWELLQRYKKDKVPGGKLPVRPGMTYGETDPFEVGQPWKEVFFVLDHFEGEADDPLGWHQPRDARVYLFAVAPEMRMFLNQEGASPFLVVTLGEVRITKRFYDEDTFVDLFAREWVSIARRLKAPFVGADGQEDDDGDTECEACGAQTRLWTDPDPKDPESELERQDAAKFCGNCGAQIPIDAEIVPT